MIQQLDYQQFKDKQAELRQTVLDIIQSYPKLGIYQNEISESNWNTFISHYLSILERQEGERGTIAKQISQELNLNSQQINSLFQELQIPLNHKTHIRQITEFFETYTTCQLHIKWKKIKVSLENQEKIYQYLSTSQEKKSSIIQGLQKKYDSYNSEKMFKEIVETSRKKLEEIQILEQTIHQELIQSDKYINYCKLKTFLDPLISQWRDVDQAVGKGNTTRGGDFENLCKTYAIELVMEKINIYDKTGIQILQNVKWEKFKGETDLILMDEQFNILALIEAKSRLFDIAEGYRQSGSEGRKNSGKVHLVIDNTLVKIPDNVPCFVITTIPPNKYYLGFESEIKADLNRISVKFNIDELRNYDFQKEFPNFVSKFSKYMSPESWFNQYGETNLIVIPQI